MTAGSDLLSHVLFDPGDFVMVPSPNYYRFTNDLGDRGLIRLAIVPTMFFEGSNSVFELRVSEFERIYQAKEADGGRVRAIMIANPQNPGGSYHTLDELRPIIKWAVKRGIFVILDEIYDLTVYNPDKVHYRSAVELFESEEECQRLIWMWGLSKNFCVPGLRVSVIYSPNEMVCSAVMRCQMIQHPNVLTQFVVRALLSDTRSFFSWKLLGM